MANQFLDHGLKGNQDRELPNKDHKQGFVDAVRNNQVGLALSYSLSVFNELSKQVETLTARLAVVESTVLDDDKNMTEDEYDALVKTSEPKPTPRKRTSKTAAPVEVPNESESQD